MTIVTNRTLVIHTKQYKDEMESQLVGFIYFKKE